MFRKAKLMMACLGLFTFSAYSQTYSSFEQFWSDAQKPDRGEKSESSVKRIQWWRDARFGMFIHWNPSSLSASEISWSKQFYDDNGENMLDNPRPDAGFKGMKEHTEWLSWFKPPVPNVVYDNLYKSFYPGMFDAGKLAELAKAAGMKYIIMVAKHHDGFCMWNSAFTDYDVMNTPFKRDILGELAAATHKAGLKFGIYYSQRDWHHPDYGPSAMTRYNAYMRNQVKELLTNYGEISVLFFDSGEWQTWELWEGDQIFKLACQLQPNIIINNRCGVPADYSTPEQKLGGFNNKRSWESCMTLTGFWSWHGFQTPVISYEECMKYLISCAGGDGNLLMNIGPMPTGQIDPREENRLLRIGEWLKLNGESIYGTRGGPFLPDSSIASTYNKDQIFVHVFRRQNGTVMIPKIKEKIIKAEVLSGPEIYFTQTEENITISIPLEYIKNIVTVVVLKLDKPVDESQIPEI